MSGGAHVGGRRRRCQRHVPSRPAPATPSVAWPAAARRQTDFTGRFSVDYPLCARRARARVLRSAIEAAEAWGGGDVATMASGDGTTTFPRFSGMPAHRRYEGQIAAMALYAGQGVGQVVRTLPAAEVVMELDDEAERLLRSW